jgi:4-amino-4-deoxy-L-arabinose transferase-like glycosyltransferase
MRSSGEILVTTAAPLLLVVLFASLCLLFLPLLGPQEDEVLFATTMLAPPEPNPSIPWFSPPFPLMLDFYLGALKGWLYAPLLRWLPPGEWTLRLPVVALGALTLWLFFRWLARATSFPAALAASLLLAVDPVFLLTTTFDWGPCALQRFFLVALCALLTAYARQPSPRLAILAGLCLGFACWDKLTFLWLASGCGAATLLLYPRPLARHLRSPHLPAAFVAALAGAAPLIYANWGAFSEARARYSSLPDSTLFIKAFRLWTTLNGESLFPFLTLSPNSAAHLGAWLLVASILFVPLARRPLLWTLLALAFSTAAMFLTTGGAAGAHHLALLWPLPHMAIGLAIGSLLASSQPLFRRLAPAVLLIATAAALRVDFHYYRAITTSGAAVAWTTASPALAAALAQHRPNRIWVSDWGILGPLRYLSGGALPLHYIDTAAPEPLRAALSSRDSLFVTHAPGAELLPGTREKILAAAAAQGSPLRLLARIYDHHDKPIFDIFR